MTLETTRDDLLLSVIRGNLQYLCNHLLEVGGLVALGRRIGISGGGAGIRGMLAARRRWTGEFDYVFQDQSSMLGAAMLGQMYQASEMQKQTLPFPASGGRLTRTSAPKLPSGAALAQAAPPSLRAATHPRGEPQ